MCLVIGSLMSLLSVITGKSTHCGYHQPTAAHNYSANNAPLSRRVRGCGEKNVPDGSCARLHRLHVSSVLASRRPEWVFAQLRVSVIKRRHWQRLHIVCWYFRSPSGPPPLPIDRHAAFTGNEKLELICEGCVSDAGYDFYYHCFLL